MRGVSATALATLLAALVLFGPSAWGGHVVADPTRMRDTYHVATILAAYGRHLAHGHLPLWLPEVAGGAPAYAAWMYGLLSPGALLFALFAPGTAWTWSAVLHMTLAAAGLHAYLRARGLSHAAAATGALTLAFSEYVVSRTIGGHLNLVWPLAWAPWVLVAGLAAARGRRGGVPALAAVGALALVSGHVQIWFFLGPVCAGAALAEARAAGGGAALRRVVAGGALALLLAAVQWLPTAEYVAHAGRVDMDAEHLRAWSAAPAVLAEKVAPGLLGTRPVSRWAPGLYENESALAGGLGLLFLVALGVRRGAGRRAWCGVLVVALLLALGEWTRPTHLLGLVPPFTWSRVPGRALVAAVLAVAVLAAHGAEVALASDAATWRAALRRAAVGTGVLGVGALAALRIWAGSLDWAAVSDAPDVGVDAQQRAADLATAWAATATPALLASLAGLALVVAAAFAVRRLPRARLALPAAALVAAWLAAPPVQLVPDAFLQGAAAQAVPPELRDHRVQLADTRMPYPELDGVGTLRPLSHVGTVWLHTAVRGLPPERVMWWFALSGVLVVAPPPPPGAPLDLPQRVRFQRPPWPLPERARVYRGADCYVSSLEQNLAELRTGADVLAADTVHDWPAGKGPLPGATARIVADGDPNALVVDVDAPERGVLFLAESWYPGWTCDAGELARANVNFRAVQVPAGRTRVTLRFLPASFLAGAVLSFAALVVVLLLARRDLRRGAA